MSGVVGTAKLLVRFVCVMHDAIDAAKNTTKRPGDRISWIDKGGNWRKFQMVHRGFLSTLRNMISPTTAFKLPVKKGMALMSKLIAHAESLGRTGIQFCACFDTRSLDEGVARYIAIVESWESVAEDTWDLQKCSDWQLSRSPRCVCHRPVETACSVSWTYGRILHWHSEYSRCTKCKLSDLDPVDVD